MKQSRRRVEARMYWACISRLRDAQRRGDTIAEREYRDEIDVLHSYASCPIIRQRCAEALGRAEASCAS